MSEKKYPCLFGLKDECDVRKYVEENLLPQKIATATATPEEEKVVEKALKNTKVLQFNDEKTAKEIGKSAAEGALGVLSGSMAAFNIHLKPQLMVSYCSMCPIRGKALTEAMKGESKK